MAVPDSPDPADPTVPGNRPTPAVAAIIVTHDPGPWLEEALASFASQDYEELSVLVVDAGSSEDIRPRVAAAHPHAFVRRLEDNVGFAAAANTGAAMVDGASFLLLCHDDVAIEPGSIRALVDEAYRSNAGVVGPKLVRWDRPREILSVGMAADKLGAPVSAVEPGEFDQGQHDHPRDVFFVPSAATLVRADLFAELGGLDEKIAVHGEDLDLCWRIHLAGSRVVVSPSATVRHLEGLGDRREGDDRRRMQMRHQLRTMLSCYSGLHLVRVLPQAAVLAGSEAGYSVVAGRRGQAGDVLSAWTWNLRNLGPVLGRRRRIAKTRNVPDREIRSLQAPGFARLGAFLRGQIGRGGATRFDSMAESTRGFTEYLRTGPDRWSVAAWAFVALMIVIGSRQLISGSVPMVGEMASFGDGPGALFDRWTSGWREAGLGSDAAAPTAYGLLGLGATAFLGAMGLLRQVLILGLLPLGALGAWRLARPLGSPPARAATLVAYGAVPVAYNAMAGGSWSGLVAYAAAPWLLSRLLRASNLTPFASPGDEGVSKGNGLAAGVILALVVAVVPLGAGAFLVVAAGLIAGCVLTGDLRALGRVGLTALVAVGVAALLHIPWIFEFATTDLDWSALGGVHDGAGDLGVPEILRFETGPFGAGLFSYGLLVVAAVPLLVGRSWRATWAARLWPAVLAPWVVLWVGESGWSPVGLPDPEVVLAPGAAALALLAGFGVTAFERDIRGQSFGWRQPVAALGVVGLLAAGAVLVSATVSGRWDMPATDFRLALSFLDDRDDGDFRVLWMGQADVMPVGGWSLADDVLYGTTTNGLPVITDQWAGSPEGATEALAEAVIAARDSQTSRLGRLLAPMGVRYVVVAEGLAPAAVNEVVEPAPEAVLDSLAGQIDLEEVGVDPAVVVYENTAWAPLRSTLPPSALVQEPDDESADPRSPVDEALARGAATDLTRAKPVLPDEVGFTEFRGPVEEGQVVYHASAPVGSWRLAVDGQAVAPEPAFGFGSAFTVPAGGMASLTHSGSGGRLPLLVLQIGLWALVLVRLARLSARRGATV